MFISHVSEDVSGVRGGKGRASGVRDAKGRASRVTDDSLEYRTASELFELMSRNQDFHANKGAPLSTARELVFLYKNIDIGSKILSDSKEYKRKSPNQRVESIVYEDFDSDSDLSENCSNGDDLCNMLMINKEQIDCLNSSLDNTFCQNFRDFEDTDSKLRLENNFFDQKMMSRLEPPSCPNYHDNVLAVSPHDYLNTSGLQGNCKIPMDSVIRYVNYTIDQLKRISNGDYLTDKAKEKWKEHDYNKALKKRDKCDTKKALVKPTINPIPIQKATRGSNKWDAVIHSECDFRTFSKILDKKIVVEVSKPLRESLKFLNLCRPNNLVITCKTKNEKKLLKQESSEERIDVKLKLNQLVTTYVVNRITAINIAQEPDVVNVLPLPCKEATDSDFDGPNNKETLRVVVKELKYDDDKLTADVNVTADKDRGKENQSCMTQDHITHSECYSTHESYNNSVTTVFAAPATTNMYAIMQRLNMQIPLPEKSNEEAVPLNQPDVVSLPEKNVERSVSPNPPHSTKKRSSSQIRVKSPYENKSRILDDRRRKKLIEIRQKREKMKQVLKESVKDKDRRFSRVNSITKLSISNKSFYDSIYGHSQNLEGDQKSKKDMEEILEIKKYDKEIEGMPDTDDSPNTKSQKFINRNYFLDEAVTEMMLLNMNRKGDSQSESEVSPRYYYNVPQELSEFVNSRDGALSTRSVIGDDSCVKESPVILSTPESLEQKNPMNTPTIIKKTDSKVQCTEDNKTENPSAQFRKSIDKIYDLINKRAKTDGSETKCKSKFTAVAERTPCTSFDEQSVHCTDSGTSLKHCLSSSNPSCYSFNKSNEKNNKLKVEIKSKYQNINKVNIVPKLVVNSKSHDLKADEKKKERISTSPKGVNANPLKAISQLLHEFDDVQRCRKNVSDKQLKKAEVSFADGKGGPRSKISPERSMRGSVAGTWRSARQPDSQPHAPGDATLKPVPRVIRKKVNDIVDEMREARGEAVRGPSFRLNARLNSLAQPKRTYVQAQIEDFQMRYGKSVITDRLQRLNASPEPQPKLRSPRKKLSPVKNTRFSPPPSPVPDKAKSNRTTAFTVNLQKLTLPLSDAINVTPKRSSIGATTSSSSKTNPENMSRIPLLPNDFEIVSDSLTSTSKADDSSIIGNKIHQLIDSVVTRQDFMSELLSMSRSPMDSPSSLLVNDSDNQEKDAEGSTAKSQSSLERSMSEINFSMAPYEPLVRTQLQTVNEIESLKEEEENVEDIETDNSVKELENIEKALYHQISVGNTSNRLRHKKFTLTPKESLILSLRSTSDRSIAEKHSSIKTMNELATLYWPLSQFPVQIATVGYAFPKYNKSVQNFTSELRTDNAMQCFKGSGVDKVTPYAIELLTQLLQIGSSALLEEKKQHVLENIEEEEDKNAGLQCETTAQVADSCTDLDMPLTTAIVECNSPQEDSKAQLPQEDSKAQLPQEDSKAQLPVSDVHNSHKSTPANEQQPQLPSNVKEKTESNDTYRIDSLDVLVGLLNEIQKITSNQSKISFPENEDVENALNNATSYNLQQEVQNIISFTSLDKLRQLESNPSSLYSFCLSDSCSIDNDTLTEKVINSHFMNDYAVAYTAKEIETGVQVKELVHKGTNVPSQVLPRMHNHGTYVTNSLIGVLSEPSSESTIDFNDWSLKRRSSFTCLRNVIKIPKSSELINQSTYCKKNIKEVFLETEPKQITVINVKTNKKKDAEVICLKEVKSNTKIKAQVKAIVPYKKKKVTEHINRIEKVVKRNNKYDVVTDLDPADNLKRELLVTVYSLLVFTVFAALSIPDILYKLY